MKNPMIRKLCSGLLTAALVLSTAIVPGTASHAATTPKDVKGHWAQKYIEKAIDAGIVAGYSDGNFRPENAVTRAEFSHMLNSVLGNTGTATINFKDVTSKDWYYSDVSKAVAAGYTNGYTNNTFQPNNRISRQEAAAMLAQIVPTYGSAASLTKYKDYNSVAAWARPAMERMVGKGYINVYTSDQKLHPTDKMTRAQAATIVVNMMEKETIVKTASTVNANGTQLSNTIYSNGLTVPSTAASGSLELNKCVVLGPLSANGGNTITLTNSRASQITLQNSSGITLIAKGETSVKNVSAASSASLQTSGLTGDATYGPGFVNTTAIKNTQLTLNGSFPKVTLDGTGVNATLISGKIDNLVVSAGGTGSDFTLQSGTSVTAATAGSPVYLHGTGTIAKLTANASGITYETKPSSITVANGITAPTQGSHNGTVSTPGVTVSPTSNKKDVYLDTSITLTFNSAMKLYDGTTITDMDVQSIVELHKDTSSGPKVNFTATVDSARKVMTLEPNTLLTRDTEYFISVAKNKLKDSSGNGNAALLSSFITGTDTGGSSTSKYMTFTPKDGSKNIDLDIKPQIHFSESMVCYDGTSIKTDDLEDMLIFRENSSSGSRVKFDAAISSDKMTITIQPEDELDEDTKYYLAVDSNALKTASKNTVVPSAAVTWTTGDGSDSSSSSDSDYISFTPKNNKTDIAIDVEPEIRFTEKMECYDGSTINSSALDDIVIFREKSSSGKDVEFHASIDNTKKIITVIPEDDLDEDKKYYLAIDSKAIRTTADGTRVPGASVTWTTGDEDSTTSYVTFYPRDNKSDVSRSVVPTITFKERVDFYGGDRIDSGRSSDLEDCITFEDEDGDDVDFRASYDTSKYEITIEPTSRLSYDTEYTLSIERRSFETRADGTAIPAASVSWTVEE